MRGTRETIVGSLEMFHDIRTEKAKKRPRYKPKKRLPFSISGSPKTAKTIDMKGFQMFIKVTQYAEQRNVSPRRVRQWIQTGKIHRNSWKRKGKMYRIDPAKADKDLSENLDRIYNPVKPSDELERFLTQPMPDIIPAEVADTDRVEIQDQAADIACEGEEPGYMHPTPIWNIRYIAALVDLDPDSVDVKQISKTKWRVTIADIDNDDRTPCPWSADLVFNYNLGSK